MLRAHLHIVLDACQVVSQWLASVTPPGRLLLLCRLLSLRLST